MKINFEISKEEKYILKYLFNEILGICPNLSININSYVLEFGNKTLVINNSFFFREYNNTTYININSIPQELNFFSNLLSDGELIPMIYGEDKLIIKPNYIYCGLDIIASSFFMLSRWEELVLPKDKFGRCDENEMFVVKHNIYNRPIVNEYINLLKDMLQYLGVKINPKDTKFTPLITHDIDELFRYDFKNLMKNVAGDIIHRKSIKQLCITLKNYSKFIFGFDKDPFDTFDFLMDLSDKYGLKDEFYFKSNIKGESDCDYDIFDKRIKGIIRNIINRGHYIGFHPSMDTFYNEEQFAIELERLKTYQYQIAGGRQHFLLYNLPNTIDVWEQNGLKYDTGLGFAFRAGFRCGICWEYPFFNAILRKECDLLIKPLILMEGALLQFDKNRSLDSIKEEMLNLIDIVKLYNGIFVFLWHNDHFKRPEYIKHGLIYKEIIDYIGSKMDN